MIQFVFTLMKKMMWIIKREQYELEFYDDEWLLVDDVSTDDSLDIKSAINHRRRAAACGHVS